MNVGTQLTLSFLFSLGARYEDGSAHDQGRSSHLNVSENVHIPPRCEEMRSPTVYSHTTEPSAVMSSCTIDCIPTNCKPK